MVQEIVPSVLERALIEVVGWQHGETADEVWHRPFFEAVDVPSVPLDEAVADLARCVDALVVCDPSTLPEPASLRRATDLLGLASRLQAAVLTAVADVDARELFTGAHAGSTRAWLRSVLGGDPQLLPLARRLRDRPHVAAALADGRLEERAAEVMTAALAALPDALPEDQLAGVLAHGVPDTLDVAHGGTLTAGDRSPEQEALAEQVQGVVEEALAEAGARPADRLERPFVLLAGALPVTHLPAAVGRLLDALQPEALEDRERRDHDDRSLRLVKKRLGPGWRLEAHLTDEEGLALHEGLARELAAETGRAGALAALAARVAASTGAADVRPPDAGGIGAQPSDDRAAGSVEGGACDASASGPARGVDLDAGATGPGHPPDPAHDATVPTSDQRRHDAFVRLLRRTSGPPGHAPPLGAVTITCTLAALEGQTCALPGAMAADHPPPHRTGSGALTGAPTGAAPRADARTPPPITLSAAALQRLACDSTLSAVLLDAAGSPVGASSSRRHATRRERRALRARQGTLCGVNGCPRLWTVPHHVEPFHLSGRTVLRDLLGVCSSCHHDVHLGRRALRLRDGRLIDDRGCVEG